MPILPDYLGPNLRVVFCGTAVAKRSAERGRYYAGTGNEFWELLFRSGLVPVRLSPENDERVSQFGLGLTDLAKEVSASSDRGLRSQYSVDQFLTKIEHYRPTWVAFHGKEAAKAVTRHLGVPRDVKLGRQTWKVGGSAVFVLPSASGANRDPARLEGKADRLEWFKELAGLVGRTGSCDPTSPQSGQVRGDCFQASYQHLMELTDAGQGSGHTLVHAVVTHPQHGTFTHAWVEREQDGVVIDVSNRRRTETSRDTFYRLLQVKHVVRYAANDALMQNLRSMHYGPWDELLDRYDPQRITCPS